MTDAFDIAAMKRDLSRPRLTKGWRVVTDVPAPGWVQVVGPAFKVDGPTTATDLNGEDYLDRHRDARRIARVPEMEAEILRLREGLTEIERLYYTEAKDASWRAAQMRAIAQEMLK